jgi:hypothetical protein
MKVAFGIKAHSGWAALVVASKRDADLVVAERRERSRRLGINAPGPSLMVRLKWRL